MQETMPVIFPVETSDQSLGTLILDTSQIENVVLKRLIEEVQLDHAASQLNAYNRTHNRHNRGR